jgi:threonine/homoserine/homoserine lactone efflux protein
MELSTWLTFFAASWAISISPGPGAIASMSAGLNHGFKRGYVTIFGLVLGIWTQIAVVGLGLGALVATSATAFTVVKWLGAAYLVWLGVRILLAKAPSPVPVPEQRQAALPMRPGAVFRGGFLTNVLNPKVALFFLAFVPQFIPADAPDKVQAFLLLGLLFTLNSIPVNSGWALAAAWLARRDVVRHAMHWLDRAAAVMFIGFGVALAVSDHPPHPPTGG